MMPRVRQGTITEFAVSEKIKVKIEIDRNWREMYSSFKRMQLLTFWGLVPHKWLCSSPDSFWVTMPSEQHGFRIYFWTSNIEVHSIIWAFKQSEHRSHGMKKHGQRMHIPAISISFGFFHSSSQKDGNSVQGLLNSWHIYFVCWFQQVKQPGLTNLASRWPTEILIALSALSVGALKMDRF